MCAAGCGDDPDAASRLTRHVRSAAQARPATLRARPHKAHDGRRATHRRQRRAQSRSDEPDRDHFAPKDRVLAPKWRVHAPKDRVLAPKGRVPAPKDRVLAPKGRVPAWDVHFFAPEGRRRVATGAAATAARPWTAPPWNRTAPAGAGATPIARSYLLRRTPSHAVPAPPGRLPYCAAFHGRLAFARSPVATRPGPSGARTDRSVIAMCFPGAATNPSDTTMCSARATRRHLVAPDGGSLATKGRTRARDACLPAPEGRRRVATGAAATAARPWTASP